MENKRETKIATTDLQVIHTIYIQNQRFGPVEMTL